MDTGEHLAGEAECVSSMGWSASAWKTPSSRPAIRVHPCASVCIRVHPWFHLHRSGLPQTWTPCSPQIGIEKVQKYSLFPRKLRTLSTGWERYPVRFWGGFLGSIQPLAGTMQKKTTNEHQMDTNQLQWKRSWPGGFLFTVW